MLPDAGPFDTDVDVTVHLDLDFSVPSADVLVLDLSVSASTSTQGILGSLLDLLGFTTDPEAALKLVKTPAASDTA